MGCDTFVALPWATSDGSTILAKNSDREPNEAHEVMLVPPTEHPSGASVDVTYRTIPQVRRTHAVLLSRPYWTWGAEMGVNDQGVAIGNEAIFSRVPHEKTPGLIGMDLLRLALERASTAEQAVDVIASLVVAYGQSGNCRHEGRLQYFNSFLIADDAQAWVLEAVGREWAARRVREPSGQAAISNALTLRNDLDRSSPGLIADAVRRGWCSGPDDFDFAALYSDRVYTHFSQAAHRRGRSVACLTGAAPVDVAAAMAGLRDHGTEPGTGSEGAAARYVRRSLRRQEVCMHAGFGPVRIDQTTGSMVAHLTPGLAPTVWLTGTSTPCTSVFKPVWLDGGLPDLGPRPTGRYDPATLWWSHEDLHRELLPDFPNRGGRYAAAAAALERDFRSLASRAAAGTAADRRRATRYCFAAAQAAEADWLADVRSLPRPRTESGLADRLSPYGRAWRARDRRAGRR